MQVPGFGEILFILVVALVVFGPNKLPELGRTLGSGIREFRRGTQGLKEELESSLRDPAPASQVPQAVQAQPLQVQASQPQPSMPPAGPVPVQPAVAPVPVQVVTPAPPTVTEVKGAPRPTAASPETAEHRA
ncbi:twin-arginine translocase TatA/TatE family subunit [Deinococcus lacus]|uniref:Sec-independent protein translocase protein TatA n=1 Tax=Deinococcus lacus TaxID=392561 RepID=A0ABW1Y9C0_9DEIO